VLEEMLVQWMRNIQPADERECRYVITTVGDFGDFGRS